MTLAEEQVELQVSATPVDEPHDTKRHRDADVIHDVDYLQSSISRRPEHGDLPSHSGLYKCIKLMVPLSDD